MPEVVAYSNFRRELKSWLHKVNQDADTVLVSNTDPQDNVVVMSSRDYDALMETMRIYRNPYLRDKVSRGLAEVRQGRSTPHDLAVVDEQT